MSNKYEFSINDITSVSYVDWNEVGKMVTGVLCEVRKNEALDPWGHKKMEYILQTPEGSRICVQGRSYPKGKDKVGEDYKVIFGMGDIPLGAIMAFVYAEQAPTKTGNPAKIIKPLYKGEKDEEVLKAYQAKWGGVQSNEVKLVDTGEEITLDESPIGEDGKLKA